MTALQDLIELKREQLANVRAAIAKAEEASAYSLGTRSVTRANLSVLYAREAKLEAELQALEENGTSRRKFKRVVPLG